MKSKAAILTHLNAPLEVLELDLPPLKVGQVLVQMKYSGVCRSQINEIKGFRGEDPYLPHTLGHEGSGIVLEVGEGISKVKKGDHVICTWMKGQGSENSQTCYAYQNKVVNSGAISTFLEKAIISENRLIPIPKNLPLKEAALFGCAIPTGAGIVLNDLKVPKEASLAVFGLGGIGCSALIAAKISKVKQIIGIDLYEKKLELAKELGATHVIHYRLPTLLQEIQVITNGKGVDYAIEAVGQKEAMEMAFKAVKDKGGTCLLAGNVPKGIMISCDPFDFIKGKKLMGSWGGAVNPDQHIPAFLELFLKEKRLLTKLIDYIVPIEKINETIAFLEQGKLQRALIAF